jgi:hypothetical protein
MLWRNTATGTPGTAVPFESPVNQHILTSVAIDGTRVVWVDCPTLAEGCDVYTRILAESESHLVTNSSGADVRSPYVDDDGNRIYWADARLGSTDFFGGLTYDVFTESVAGASLTSTDTTPPGPPTSFNAGPNSGSVLLTWTNPSTADFFRVRILRRPGTTAPTSPHDTRATVVYEDDGTTFTDEDVVAGRTYTYRAFAFDLEGNFSSPATDRTS